ncbi:hypothetical protein BJ928_1224 [Rhizobium sp. WW_1]|jgi:hypothetical protein|nr:hypothetical protein BJ928_1224 [Rhizobium sp. WW_1]
MPGLLFCPPDNRIYCWRYRLSETILLKAGFLRSSAPLSRIQIRYCLSGAEDSAQYRVGFETRSLNVLSDWH